MVSHEPTRHAKAARSVFQTPHFARQKEQIRQDVAQGANAALGFLHIPKTGGTALRSAFAELRKQNRKFPLTFGHSWTLALIVENFPQVEVFVQLRDPLERSVSAFNSRLRQGRPKANANWSPAEAAAFAIFRSTEEFLDALLRSDDFNLSATNYARTSVKHLVWNYVHFFTSSAAVKTNAGRIGCIGITDNSQAFWAEILGRCDIPSGEAESYFRTEHVAEESSKGLIRQYSTDEVQRMQRFFADEYEIFNELKALPQSIVQNASTV